MVSQDDLLRMQRRRSLNFQFSVPEDNEADNHGLSLHGVEFGYQCGGCSRSNSSYMKVKRPIRFSGRCRSVLLGKNGSGKSTFLDLCSGRLLPTSGHIDRTQDLKIGHYSQLTDDLDQNSTETAASYLVRECSEELAAHAGSTRACRLQGAPRVAKALAQRKRLLEVARGVLSHFGFEGDVAITAPVDSLSGGQKALLKLAVLSLRPAHILLLDEPTNNLDAEACEALAKALSEFKGGIVAVTHDELLIHRLIHCNWTTSELLICREGTVWRERNFGAQCLKALKSEVHREEEETDPQTTKILHQAPDRKPTCDAQNERVITKRGVPPWLQQKSRPRAKQQLGPDTSNQPVVEKHISKAPVSNTTSEVSCQGTPSSIRQHLEVPPPKLEKSQLAVPETWEEAAHSDATTETPDSEGVEDCAERDVAEVVNVSDDGASTNARLTNGRHSRFRKDIVNFNKAVTKWLRQEQNGEIGHSEVLGRILNSTVAHKLRVVHGNRFDENQFIQDAIKHGARKRGTNGAEVMKVSR